MISMMKYSLIKSLRKGKFFYELYFCFEMMVFFRGKEDLSNLFAAADEFTDLVNDSARYDELGVGSISNKDKADPKQLKWEMNRNDLSNGKKWKKTNKLPNKTKNKQQKIGKISKNNLANKKIK